MTPVEFYTTPEGEVMVKPEEGPAKILCPSDGDFLSKMEEAIMEFYPEAHKALVEHYQASAKNQAYFRFLMVRRFIKCNWGGYDNILDIDHLGRMAFEFVSCPMRGECKYDRVICSPKFNTVLSPREMQVMEMLYEGRSDDEIASMLYISLNTVNNHRKNSFKKLGVHNMGEFIRYAKDRNIFNK